MSSAAAALCWASEQKMETPVASAAAAAAVAFANASNERAHREASRETLTRLALLEPPVCYASLTGGRKENIFVIFESNQSTRPANLALPSE